MPGFSFLVTSLAAVLGWATRPLDRPLLATGALLTVAVLVGSALALSEADLATALVTLAAAVFCGALIGRVLPPSARAMAISLVLLSLIDIAWIGLASDAARGSAVPAANLVLEQGDARSTIGVVDVALAAAVAVHWQARGAHPVLGVASAPLGMIGANVFVGATGASDIPLVPFILAGWLVTEVVYRWRRCPR